MEGKVIFCCEANNRPSEYERVERRQQGRERRLINGRITGCGKCVGYCRYDGHPGYLDKTLRQAHDCLRKGCFYYAPKDTRDVAATWLNPAFAPLLAYGFS